MKSKKKMIRHMPLLAVLVAACLFTPAVVAETHQPVSPVSRVSVTGLSQPRKLTLLAAQGLMNRAGPMVYLDFGGENRWMQFDYTEKPEHNDMRIWSPAAAAEFREKYPTLNEAWIDILEKNAHFKFTTEPWESLLARSGPMVKGWIIYENFEDEVALMGTRQARLLRCFPPFTRLMGSANELEGNCRLLSNELGNGLPFGEMGRRFRPETPRSGGRYRHWGR